MVLYRSPLHLLSLATFTSSSTLLSFTSCTSTFVYLLIHCFFFLFFCCFLRFSKTFSFLLEKVRFAIVPHKSIQAKQAFLCMCIDVMKTKPNISPLWNYGKLQFKSKGEHMHHQSPLTTVTWARFCPNNSFDVTNIPLNLQFFCWVISFNQLFFA